jgi:hypothetical protein
MHDSYVASVLLIHYTIITCIICAVTDRENPGEGGGAHPAEEHPPQSGMFEGVHLSSCMFGCTVAGTALWLMLFHVYAT